MKEEESRKQSAKKALTSALFPPLPPVATSSLPVDAPGTTAQANSSAPPTSLKRTREDGSNIKRGRMTVNTSDAMRSLLNELKRIGFIVYAAEPKLILLDPTSTSTLSDANSESALPRLQQGIKIGESGHANDAPAPDDDSSKSTMHVKREVELEGSMGGTLALDKDKLPFPGASVSAIDTVGINASSAAAETLRQNLAAFSAEDAEEAKKAIVRAASTVIPALSSTRASPPPRAL